MVIAPLRTSTSRYSSDLSIEVEEPGGAQLDAVFGHRPLARGASRPQPARLVAEELAAPVAQPLGVADSDGPGGRPQLGNDANRRAHDRHAAGGCFQRDHS